MSSLQFLYERESSQEADARTPLSHHELMQIVAPFSRAGRQVDLPATDRTQRTVVFKSIDHAQTPELPPLREALVLEVPETQGDEAKLVRTLSYGDGADAQRATLTVTGESTERLLALVEGVDPRQHWRRCENVWLGVSYRIRSSSASTSPAAEFVAARARLDDAGAELRVEQALGGAPLEVRLLTTRHGEELDVTEDFLAVSSPSWRPLRRTRQQGWKGSLRVATRNPERTLEALREIEHAVVHLSKVFAMAPSAYHEHYRRARWRAALQRAAPLLIGGLALASLPGLMFLPARDNPAFLVLVFQLPTLCLIVFFSLREIPVLEIPPVPRPLQQPAWSRPVTSR